MKETQKLVIDDFININKIIFKYTVHKIIIDRQINI